MSCSVTRAGLLGCRGGMGVPHQYSLHFARRHCPLWAVTRIRSCMPFGLLACKPASGLNFMQSSAVLYSNSSEHPLSEENTMCLIMNRAFRVSRVLCLWSMELKIRWCHFPTGNTLTNTCQPSHLLSGCKMLAITMLCIEEVSLFAMVSPGSYGPRMNEARLAEILFLKTLPPVLILRPLQKQNFWTRPKPNFWTKKISKMLLIAVIVVVKLY